MRRTHHVCFFTARRGTPCRTRQEVSLALAHKKFIDSRFAHDAQMQNAPRRFARGVCGEPRKPRVQRRLRSRIANSDHGSQVMIPSSVVAAAWLPKPA